MGGTPYDIIVPTIGTHAEISRNTARTPGLKKKEASRRSNRSEAATASDWDLEESEEKNVVNQANHTQDAVRKGLLFLRLTESATGYKKQANNILEEQVWDGRRHLGFGIVTGAYARSTFGVNLSVQLPPQQPHQNGSAKVAT
eukprot:4010115-Amphidinium_carterae.1